MASATAARKPDSLVASAARIRLDNRGDAAKLMRTRQPWQQLAWNYFRSIGEVSYACTFLGNALSKLRIFAAELPDSRDQEPTATEDETANREAERLDAGAGHAGLMREAGINLSIAGEGFLVGEMVQDSGERAESWDFKSINELIVSGDRYEIRESPLAEKKPLNDKENLVVRIWLRDPEFSALAWSPLQGVLDQCEALIYLEKVKRAQAKSRIAGAGILKVPSELTFGPPDPTQDTSDGEERKDPFMDQLLEAMVTPIQDEGSASAVVPLLVRGPGEILKYLELLRFDRPFDPNVDLAIERALTRLAQGLNVPVEVVKGLAGINHWCVDEETEILTSEGWKSHDALAEGDLVLALDHETGASRWSPVRDIYRAEVNDEPMVAIEMAGHSSLTTPNHRWPTIGRKPWRTTETLREEDRLLRAAPSEAPVEAKWADATVELMGWLWTEGNVQGGAVRIAQSHTVNPDRVARIRAALSATFGPAESGRWREAVQENRSSFGGPVTVFYLSRRESRRLLDLGGKRPSAEFIKSLTAAQLALFIDVSLQGDGQHYRQGRRDIWAADPSMLDPLELAAVLGGYAVTRSDHGHRLNLARKPTIRPVKAHRASFRQGRGPLIRDRRYTGTIWCPVTDEQTWCARRRGTVYFTGNTAWQVDESAFKMHIEPLAVAILDALTDGFFRPALRGAGVKNPERFVLWYDASRLVQPPDKAETAKAAYGAPVPAISGAALRKVLGLGDDDAPSEREILLQGLLGRGRFTEETTDALLRYLLPELVNSLTVAPTEEKPDEEPPAGAPVPIPPDIPAAPSSAAAQLTAAKPKVRTDLGARLLEVDRTLRTRLTVAADGAVRRALERAGARIRTKAKGSASAAIRDVPDAGVAAALGPAVVAQAGVPDDSAFAAMFEPLHSQFDTWVTDAQAEALELIPDLSDAEAAALAAEQEQDRNEAWLWLLVALVALTKERLYETELGAGEGEADLTSLIPAGLIRQAMARAGGEVGLIEGSGFVATLEGGFPIGGVGLGRTIREALAGQGVATEGYRWVYGRFPRRAFLPHKDLDGVIFSNFDDAVLRNSGSWPPFAFFHPGDHAGCICDFEPILLAPQILPEPVIAAAI